MSDKLTPEQRDIILSNAMACFEAGFSYLTLIQKDSFGNYVRNWFQKVYDYGRKFYKAYALSDDKVIDGSIDGKPAKIKVSEVFGHIQDKAEAIMKGIDKAYPYER